MTTTYEWPATVAGRLATGESVMAEAAAALCRRYGQEMTGDVSVDVRYRADGYDTHVVWAAPGDDLPTEYDVREVHLLADGRKVYVAGWSVIAYYPAEWGGAGHRFADGSERWFVA